MRLLLCGGGTAGHINPAIAVAEELKANQPNSKILFIGREGGSENSLISGAGFEFRTLKIQGLKHSLSPSNIKRAINAIKSVESASKIIKNFDPDVILGTGGYVCWPVIIAGRKMGIPTAIHESNITPGLTTKLLAKKCNVVFLNSETTKEHLSRRVKTVTVGNPLRRKFGKLSRHDARKKLKIDENELLILSFGGSIGAQKMNEVILEVIENYSSKDKNIRHIHAVGKRYYEEIKSEKKKYDGCEILPFIDDMPTVMRASDIVICRCGAMTLSEICEVGVASILIPSPNVTANHQYRNGRYLEQIGGAMLIEEKNLNTDILISAIDKLKNDKNGRKTRAKTLKSLSTPNSAKMILDELFLQENGRKRAVF